MKKNYYFLLAMVGLLMLLVAGVTPTAWKSSAQRSRQASEDAPQAQTGDLIRTVEMDQGPPTAKQSKRTSEVTTGELIFDFKNSGPSQDSLVVGDAGSAPQGMMIKGAAKEASFTSEIIEAPNAFESVMPKWIAGLPDGTSLVIKVRASPYGGPWSEWRTVKINDDMMSEESNETFGSIVFFDKGMRYLQYSIKLQRTAKKSPNVEQVKFFFVDPGETLNEDSSEFARQQIDPLAVVQRPAIVSRTDWGCPDRQASPSAKPIFTEVTHLIVHHTDDGPSGNDYKAWVRSIWTYHKVSRGWGDIGYNYLIDPNGTVYEGRAGGDNVMGYHFSCVNEGTMGIALLGNFSSSAPTPAALSSLKKMLAWKAAQRNIDPLGASYHSKSRLNLSKISGHSDANPSNMVCDGRHTTPCPGETLYSLLSCIRVDVAGLIGHATGDFSLSVSPNAVSMFTPQGGSASLPLVIRSVSPFNRPVTFSLSGLPSGATATFSPKSVAPPIGGTVGATLSIKTTASTKAGSYPLDILATSCGISRSVRVSLVITPAPGNITVNAKVNGTWWPVNGAGAVSYSIVGPSTSSTGTGVPSNFSNLPPGQYRLTYKGGGPGTFISVTPSAVQNLSSSSTIAFTLNFNAPPPDFSVSATPTTQTVTGGGSATYTITIQSLNGFSQPVSVSALNLPPRYVASSTWLSPATVTPKANSSVNTTLRIATNNSTQKGTFTVNIRAIGGGLTRWKDLKITVK